MKKQKPPRPPNVEMLAMNASNLLGNQAFKEAMKVVRTAYTEEMVNSRPEDTSKREHLHKCIHALSDLETALTAFIQSGKLEMSMALKQQKAKK